ncbi:MAG: peptidoglycan DD-metalloendopeptidase family protein [Phycisphaerales bacterium]
MSVNSCIVHCLLASLSCSVAAGDTVARAESEEGRVIQFHAHDHEAADTQCVSGVDRARADDAIDRFRRTRPSQPWRDASSCQTKHARYDFYPMGTRWYRDAAISNFNDLDPSPSLLDFACGAYTYDGHDATDNSLRGFAEQLVGVPVFSALDGLVFAVHDGEPDMQTQWLGQPANYVMIAHGDGRITRYWHLKKGSVAVAEGDHVVAGQQIGLVGSSGNSTGPHLHFASYEDLVPYEPFGGACNDEQGGWYEQPAVPTQVYVWDCGFWGQPLTVNFPYSPPRTGTFAFNATARKFWIYFINYPGQPVRRLRTIRPDGTVAAQSQITSAFGPALLFITVVDVPFHADLNSVPGEWKLEVALNGVVVVTAPFQVVPTVNPAANFPPEPVVASLVPAQPRQGQVVQCQVDAPLAVDDRDYDVVRYRYVWTVDGQTVRDVVSAGQADVLPRSFATPGAVIACDVTPGDGKANGATVHASTVVGTGTFDCNGNGIDDAIEIAEGATPDVNGNLIPDQCETSVVYVNAHARGTGSGVSWRDACTDLTDGLRIANSHIGDGIVEVWVAAGTYRPDQGCGDRNLSFWLLPDVHILGGFAGDETSADQRDPTANVTILSGDLNGDDTPNFGHRDDNTYNVVVAARSDGTPVIDGFHIRGGYGNGNGDNINFTLGSGAMGYYASPTFRRCVIEDNWSVAQGGGLCVEGGTYRFESCSFIGNASPGFGGGASVINCTAIFAQCRFSGNSASTGGAIDAAGSNVALVNCVFDSNAAPTASAISGTNSIVTVTNATIADNVANRDLVALDNASTLVMTNSVLWQNVGAALQAGASDISFTIAQAPIPGEANLVVDPRFADAATGDYRLQRGSPAIDSGSVSALPLDAYDLDGDGDMEETWPVAFDGAARRVDDSAIVDTGEGTRPIVDRGAFEFAASTVPGDLDGDGAVGGADLAILLGAWGTNSPTLDLTGDFVIDGADLAVLLGAWTNPG